MTRPQTAAVLGAIIYVFGFVAYPFADGNLVVRALWPVVATIEFVEHIFGREQPK